MAKNSQGRSRDSLRSHSIGFEIDEVRLLHDQSTLFAKWGMDFGLLSLGGVTLWLTSTLLSFDHPLPWRNAWSYLIGVPIVLVSIDLVMRSFVSRFLERSIQAAFLLSILVHVLMTIGAVRMLLFTEAWPELFSAVAAAPQSNEIEQLEQTAAPEYFEQSVTVSNEIADRAEYLKPVKTSEATAQESETDKQQVELDKSSTPDKPIDKPIEMPPLQEAILSAVKESTFGIDRIGADIAPPEIQSQKRERDRPLLDIQNEILEPLQARPIDIPTQNLSLAADSEYLPDDSVDEPGTANIFNEPVRDNRSSASLENRSKLEVLSPDIDSVAITRTQPSKSTMDRKSNAPMSIDLPEISASIRPLTKGALNRSVSSDLSDSASRESAGKNFSQVDIPQNQNVADEGGSGTSSEIGPPTDRRSGSASAQRGQSRTGLVASDPNSLASASGGLVNGLDSPTTIMRRKAASAANSINNNSGNGLASSLDLEPSIEPIHQVAPRSIPRMNRVPSINKIRTEVAIPTPAFQKRMSRNEGDNQSPQLGDFGPETEAAIERGLEFLSNFQRSDGSWHLDDYGDQTRLQSHTAATGLALLAFQGAGYSHLQYRYASVCKSSLDYLILNQKEDGDLYIPMDESSDANVRFYSHAIASLALCEAYGMTQDQSIRAAAQKAVDFMVSTQDSVGGGWRYQPGFESDTSVSGWYMMALKSAQLASLDVPASTFEGLSKWLDRAQVSPEKRYLYRYNPLAPDTAITRHGRLPNPTMTGVGLLMRLYTGWRRDNPDMIRGADALLMNLPAVGTSDQPVRDTYYWYYATQVLFHMGGDRWQRWNASLHPLLIQSQVNEGAFIGSWSPTLPIPDRWGPFAGRLYVTTLNLLSLEVYYRHLPIYEDTAR